MKSKLIALINMERGRFGLWSPAAMMIGIGWYFTLIDEPPPFIGVTALAVSTIFLAGMWWRKFRPLALIIFLIALGFTAAQWRAYRVATPLLSQELHNRAVEGTIEEIEPVEEKTKLVISHLMIEGIAPEQTPLRVRVSFRHLDGSFQIGDRVFFTANLYPLPAPIMPGSYDFARHFYFRSIGGNGFSFGQPEQLSSQEKSRIPIWFSNLRHAIGEDMRAHMQVPVGAVAAAMTVGETGPIPDDTKTTLRDSGLAHMLAIAGLHLGIVAGVVFFTVRLIFTLYPVVALRLPVKKIAACVALLAAGIYLFLAGCPIPAQRAFIMVSFLFIAILIDRRGITLRSLMIAAIAILLFFPESMFGASFQMSFAATLAIVALYDGGVFFHRPGAGFAGRVFQHVLGIIFTSLVATLATSSFVLYHFNRFALFGLLSNMIVVPLATFVIMPGMLIALLLMPFGWQEIGYVPMGWGTEMMIRIAAWVTNLPYASLHLPSPTESGLIASSLGILWLCLMKQGWRWLGLLPLALGFSTIALHEPVDVFISEDGAQSMARLDDGNYTMLRGNASSFRAKNWLRSEGKEDIVSINQTNIPCDKTQCLYERNGHTLLLLKTPDETLLTTACASPVDVLVVPSYRRLENCAAPKTLIDRDEFQAHGAYALRFTQDGVRIVVTRKSAHGKRLWQPDYLSPGDEE